MSTDTTAAPTTTPQVAVNDIGSEEDFLAAIDQTIKYFNDGDIVEGTIVKVDRDEVLLDIGYKTEGVIPSRELSIKHDVDPAEVVSVGEYVEALVLQKEDKEGRLILSKKRAQYERAWGTIEALKEADEPVEGTVIEVVKGGLILDIGLRGFLPASLVEMRRVRDLQPYVGRKIEAKIIELDKNRNNVVLSRRAWLEQTQSEVRSEFLNQLARGQVRKGVVSSVVNFGAFVDLGGVDGLVHVSELSWKHIDHPSEVVEVGQEVTVEVLDVDLDRERVSLSLKATQEDPWRLYARTHAIGQIVPGKVTKLVPFGAFVRVEEGIEGLVHISELAERHVEIPEQVVQVGDDCMVKVIDIDLDRRRISLSLKQANEGMTVDTEFDPTRYGMAAEYDEPGNYIYPEGFDVDTGEWREGFEAQREAWEREYAEAHTRYEQHIAQIRKSAEADAEAAADGGPRRRDQLLLRGRGPGRIRRLAGQRRAAGRAAGEALRRRVAHDSDTVPAGRASARPAGFRLGLPDLGRRFPGNDRPVTVGARSAGRPARRVRSTEIRPNVEVMRGGSRRAVRAGLAAVGLLLAMAGCGVPAPDRPRCPRSPRRPTVRRHPDRPGRGCHPRRLRAAAEGGRAECSARAAAGHRDRPVHAGHRRNRRWAAPNGSPAATPPRAPGRPRAGRCCCSTRPRTPARTPRCSSGGGTRTSRTGCIGTCRSARPARCWWSAAVRPCSRWSTARPRSP